MNNKGFTLLEVLIASAIACMLAWYSQMAIINMIRQVNKITNQVNQTVHSMYQVIYLDDNQCHKADATYSVKEYNANTVMVYSDAHCTNALGTLGALTNDTYFNDIAMTQWTVSCNPGRLRMLVVNLK